jgi:hypothetical protein
MVTITSPRQYLGTWVKPAPIADVLHCVLRYNGLVLEAYCGCAIPVQNASKAVKGARHCVDCTCLRRKHLKERSDHVSTRK